MLEKQYFPSTFGDGDLHQGTLSREVMWKNRNGLAGTSGLEPPIMSWYSCKNNKIFMNAHGCVHIGSLVLEVHSGSHNYTEFAYQVLLITVSPLSSHNNISPLVNCIYPCKQNYIKYT